MGCRPSKSWQFSNLYFMITSIEHDHVPLKAARILEFGPGIVHNKESIIAICRRKKTLGASLILHVPS